ENWGLDDPSGKSDDEFKKIIKMIENNIFALKNKLTE
ncbi:MAG: arsenate reductase ArsC, partial [Lachnospirales bacterium]